MICPSCATENEAGAKFCNECGTPLAAPCPNCGATNKPGAKFCNECGTQLAGGLGAPPAAAAAAGAAVPSIATPPTSERRLVTVLFADIVGFTPFAEERDAEDVRDTLSRYFELCAEVIGRYGGTVEKYIGDAVMAVWGAPTAHEDDAERAVRAALELVGSVSALGPAIEARAGVLTGEAAVTLGATNQGIVAGDIVNTASRLQSAAPPGTVLVGEATYRAAANAVAFEEAGEQVLKGKQAPVAAWRAVRVVAERGGRNRSGVLEAPFVGRVDELRLLKELFHATGREQKVRLVSVMGPAGIGKSRLAWEFLKYVDGLVETTFWHSGRSPAYGEGITFWALGEMIRSRCGLSEGDDETMTRRKVAETVAQWITDEDERARIEPALLTLLGIESGTASDSLFGAWRTFFERIAEQGTVTLVFEDMHFADSGLLDFIEHMIDWSRGHPIYIVCLTRPDLLERRPDWGAGKRNFTSTYLEPLSDANMRELLAGLVPGLPKAAVDLIVKRADGIPFYAVETVRMLVADGRLIQRDGTYEPAGDLTSVAVPESLTALIASRLDSLDPADRSVIHDAAVLGQTFTLAALAAVSGADETELEPRLRALVRREMLTREADERSAERGQYGFVQALIREVAYNTLSKRDRKTRHLAAARYFEQLGSDELAGALAGHYLAAHANAGEGAEAEALAAQARVALRAAADRAARLGAFDQAGVFVQQALAVARDPADEAELLERGARFATATSKFGVAADLARAALAKRETLSDRVAAADAVATLGFVLLEGRRDREAREILEKALADYGDLWPDPAAVRIKLWLARVLGEFDEMTRLVELADEALEIAEHANLPRLLADALVTKGYGQSSRGRLREGIALISAGEQVAREHELTDIVIGALTVRGLMLGEVDNVEALRCYREGAEIARRVGRLNDLRQMVNNIGYTSFLTGEWDEGLALLDEGLEQDLDITERLWLLSNELIIRVNRGEDVSQTLAEAHAQAVELGESQIVAATYDPMANLAQAQGRYDEARDYFLKTAAGFSGQVPQANYQAARSALWSADLEGLRSHMAAIDASGFHGTVVEARRTTLRAGIAALDGRRGEAVAAYRDAIRAWHDVKMVWEEALTCLDAATSLGVQDPEVAAMADNARQIFERVGARPYLERLDDVVARSAGPAPRSPSSTSSTARVRS